MSFAGLRKYRRVNELTNAPTFTFVEPVPQAPPLLSHYNVNPIENHGPMPRGLPRAPITPRPNVMPERNPPPPLEFFQFAYRGP